MNRPLISRAGSAVAAGAPLWFCAVAMAQVCNPPVVARFGVPPGGTSPSQARIDFDGAVVAIADRSVPGPNGDGVVRVYRSTGTGWSSPAELRPNGSEGWAGFGGFVSVNEDRVLVGGDDGAALFTLNGNQWNREQLFPSDFVPFPFELLGEIKLRGQVLVVTQRPDAGSAADVGRLHVFRHCRGWTYAQQVTPAPEYSDADFARALATDGQNLFVGSPGAQSGISDHRGVVHRYEDNGTKFVLRETLIPPATAEGSAFGSAVAYDGDLLAIGAPDHVGGSFTSIPQAGAVILYVPYMDDWIRRHTIYEPVPTPGSNFGKLVAISGGWLTVASNTGAYAFRVDDPGNPGSAIDLQATGNSGPVVSLSASGTTVLILREGAEEAVLYDLSLAGRDCNVNGIPDYAELADGVGYDCQGNCVLDECELASGQDTDCNGNNIPDGCEVDCNDSGRPDDCDIAIGNSEDCNANGVPDECHDDDCDWNGMPDSCQLAQGLTPDCDDNGIVDECQEDDCDFNGVPDSCQLAMGALFDCNDDGAIDRCGTHLGELSPPPEVMDRDVEFGAAIDTNGELLIIGAAPDYNDELTPGAVIVYRRSGDEWTLDTVLDAAALDPDVSLLQFGRSVATDGSTVVVGAERAAVVYRHIGDTWAFEAVLLPDHYEGNSVYFGAAVDVDGDLIVVGDAAGQPTTAWGAGAVTVFRRAGGSWIPEHVFFGPHNGGYGAKVQLQGERFVTASNDAYYGAFVVVNRNDGWQVEAELPPSDSNIRRVWSVSLNGDTLALGTRTVGTAGLIYRFDGVDWNAVGVIPRDLGSPLNDIGFHLVAGRLYVLTKRSDYGGDFRRTRILVEEDGSWHPTREFRSPYLNGTAAFVPSGTVGAYSNRSTNTVTLIDPLSPRCDCPTGEVEFLDPPDGVVDARQAYPADGFVATYGIDSVLVRAPAGSVECWSLCDTAVSPMDQLRISQIERLGGDQYLLKLARPMTPGMQARITYTDLYDTRTTAEFAFRPGDVNADGATTPADVVALVNMLNGQQSIPWGAASTDIDRNGITDFADVARLIEIVQEISQSGTGGPATGARWRGCP